MKVIVPVGASPGPVIGGPYKDAAAESADGVVASAAARAAVGSTKLSVVEGVEGVDGGTTYTTP